jgi:stress-induced morphogen
VQAEQIKSRLIETFPDAEVSVCDLTGTQNHWQVQISTMSFQGLSRIQQHQAVMKVFDPELQSGEVHALSLKTIVQQGRTQ